MSEPTGPAKPRGPKGPKASQEPSAVDPRADESPVADPQVADTTPTSAVPTPTQPLPATGAAPAGAGPAGAVPTGAAPAGAVPAFSEAVPAGPPRVGPPSGPPPVGPPGGTFGPVAGGPAGPPPRGPGLWRQATSTTGGLIAVVIAAALCALLLLGAVATVGLVAVRAMGHDGESGMERVREDGQGLPPGQQRKLDRMPQSPDSQGRPGKGNGMGDGQGDGSANGMGELMRGAMGLGNVQHGEFTVQQDDKAVVMTLQRGAVTKASDTSVTVKSDDDFTATYVLGDDTRGRTKALAVGDSVFVVAEKTGAKAVMVAATRKG